MWGPFILTSTIITTRKIVWHAELISASRFIHPCAHPCAPLGQTLHSPMCSTRPHTSLTLVLHSATHFTHPCAPLGHTLHSTRPKISCFKPTRPTTHEQPIFIQTLSHDRIAKRSGNATPWIVARCKPMAFSNSWVTHVSTRAWSFIDLIS